MSQSRPPQQGVFTDGVLGWWPLAQLRWTELLPGKLIPMLWVLISQESHNCPSLSLMQAKCTYFPMSSNGQCALETPTLSNKNCLLSCQAIVLCSLEQVLFHNKLFIPIEQSSVVASLSCLHWLLCFFFFFFLTDSDRPDTRFQSLLIGPGHIWPSFTQNRFSLNNRYCTTTSLHISGFWKPYKQVLWPFKMHSPREHSHWDLYFMSSDARTCNPRMTSNSVCSQRWP